MTEQSSQNEDLSEELSSLHQLLEDMPIADSCTEQNLKLIAREIELVITTGKTPEEAFSESLEQQLIEYEEEHPAVVQTIRQLMQALSNIGV